MLTRRKATEPSRAATTLGTKNRRGVAETTWRCKRRPGGRRMFWAQVLAQAAGGRRLRGGAGLGSSLPLSLFWRLTGRGAGQICKGEGRQTRVCVCVRVRAMLDLGDGDEAGTGSHKAYMMAVRWCRFRASAQGVVLAGCQVPGGGEAAEGRGQRAEGEQRGSSPGAQQVQAWRRLVWRAETGGAGRWLGGTTLASLPETARQGQGRTRVKPVPTSCLVCLWDMARTAPFSERWTRLPGTSFTCPARRERGSVQQYRPRRSPNTIIGPRREKVQGTAGRGSRVEGGGVSQHTHETRFHRRAAGEAMEQIKTFRWEVGGGRGEGSARSEEFQTMESGPTPPRVQNAVHPGVGGGGHG